MSDKCAIVREKVAQLELKVEELRDEVADSTGSAKHGYAALLLDALHSLDNARGELRNCESAP
jgi:hypothetical protein